MGLKKGTKIINGRMYNKHGAMKLSQREFERRINEKYGNDVKVVGKYKGIAVPILIKTKYGTHKCNPRNLMKKDKLIMPSIKTATNKSEYFINRSKEIYGADRFDYSKTKYKASNKKVTITCPIHGDFQIAPNSHYQGYACPKCGENKRRLTYIRNHVDELEQTDSSLYLIRCWNDSEEFYKIGSSSKDIKRRFSGETIPYNFELIRKIDCNRLESLYFEYKVLEIANDMKRLYVPKQKFSGHTECFTPNLLMLNEIKMILDKCGNGNTTKELIVTDLFNE